MVKSLRYLFWFAMIGCGAFVFIALYGEHADMRRHSPLAMLAIPEPIRTVVDPGFCSAPLFSKRYVSCAGVCGSSYHITVSTRQTNQELQNRLSLQDRAINIKATDVHLFETDSSGPCRSMEIAFIVDDRRHVIDADDRFDQRGHLQSSQNAR